MRLMSLCLTVIRLMFDTYVWFLQAEGAQSAAGRDAGPVQERVVSAGRHTIRQTNTQKVWPEA